MKTSFIGFVLYSCIGLAGMTIASTAVAREQEAIVAPSVVVTATRVERDLSEIPISVSVVGEKEIQRNPKQDVASQIADVPGIQIFGQTAAGTRRVLVRGMAAARTLILIDGVKQPELRGIDGSYFNTDPANIERIEVIKGPASVLYGSDAIGGVINIITKKGTSATKPFGFRAEVVYNSAVNALEPKGSFYGNHKGFNYRFSGSGIDAGDRQTPKGNVWHSSFKQQQFSGQVGYDWGRGNVSFSIDQYTGLTEGVPTTQNSDGIYVPTNPDKTSTLLTLSEADNTRTVYNLTTQFEDISTYFKRLKFHGFFQELENNSRTLPTYRNAAYYAAGQKTAKTDKEQTSYGGSVQSEWTFGERHYVTFGLDYDKAVFDSKGYSFAATGALRSAVDDRDGYQQSTAIFLQDEWELIDKLTLTLGLRQTWVKTNLTKYSTNPNMENSVKDDNLVGSAGLVYTGIENYSFRALFSQGYRNPNLLQLFMGSGTMMLPNPDLKPEKSNNYELGVRYNDGTLNADLGFFFSDMKDGLSMQEVGPNEYQYINYNKVHSMGAELALDYTFHSLGLTPYVSATWLRYETKDNGFSNTHNGRPSVWGKAGLKWEKEIGEDTLLFTDANLVMTTGAYTNSRDAAGVVSRSNDRPGWATANFSIGVEGKLASTDLKYNSVLSFQNLFDKYYTPIMSTPMPEPGFTVVWSFGIEY